MSRYTCRATLAAADFLGFLCKAVGSCYTPPEGPCRTRRASTARVLHVKRLSKGVALQGDVASTLASVALHCATMSQRVVLSQTCNSTALRLSIGHRLSGSHRSTHIASDLVLRALAPQAKPQRESESRAFRIARS